MHKIGLLKMRLLKCGRLRKRTRMKIVLIFTSGDLKQNGVELNKEKLLFR